jgi:hypothetical protein
MRLSKVATEEADNHTQREREVERRGKERERKRGKTTWMSTR